MKALYDNTQDFEFVAEKIDIFSIGLILLKFGVCAEIKDFYDKFGFLDIKKKNFFVEEFQKRFPENEILQKVIEKLL